MWLSQFEVRQSAKVIMKKFTRWSTRNSIEKITENTNLRYTQISLLHNNPKEKYKLFFFLLKTDDSRSLYFSLSFFFFFFLFFFTPPNPRWKENRCSLSTTYFSLLFQWNQEENIKMCSNLFLTPTTPHLLRDSVWCSRFSTLLCRKQKLKKRRRAV
jgi:hypothetical protein